MHGGKEQASPRPTTVRARGAQGTTHVKSPVTVLDVAKEKIWHLIPLPSGSDSETPPPGTGRSVVPRALSARPCSPKTSPFPPGFK